MSLAHRPTRADVLDLDAQVAEPLRAGDPQRVAAKTPIAGQITQSLAAEKRQTLDSFHHRPLRDRLAARCREERQRFRQRVSMCHPERCARNVQMSRRNMEDTIARHACISAGAAPNPGAADSRNIGFAHWLFHAETS